MDYMDFIRAKKHKAYNYGLSSGYSFNRHFFDYQQYVGEYAIKKGRAGVFLDTGLGKTIIELWLAEQYAKHCNKPSLIITPLAVAYQFIKAAKVFDIGSIEYSKDGKHQADIVVCNYERLDKFSESDFGCVVLDESSILKNFDGATKAAITRFMKNIDYRFLFTATPSPNDFVELGTSSEALGYMGYMDMLSKFFTNNEDTIKPQNIGTKWLLKSHATKHFFEWVSSWSISMRKPSDLGFPDDRFKLPDLITNHHKVFNDSNLCIDGQMQFFAMQSSRLTEVREEQKATIENRCAKAVELASQHETSVYWCNFNKEAEILAEMDSGAREIKGSMSIDKKEELLLAFAEGDIKKLITKPKITAFGLNWQHCNHTVYFPTFSYEQYYQAIRRFWRFGQQRPVVCDLVYSDGQGKVVEALMAKAKKADDLFTSLNSSINSVYYDTVKSFDKPIQLPNFLGE